MATRRRRPGSCLLSPVLALVLGCGDGEKPASSAAPTEAAPAVSSITSVAPPAPEARVLALADLERVVAALAQAAERDGAVLDGPATRAVVHEHVGSLTKTCDDAAIDPATRTMLLKAVAGVPDPRVGDCVKKALTDAKPTERGEDLRYALRAVARARLTSLAKEVMTIFQAFRFSDPRQQPIAKDLLDALRTVAAQADEGALLELLRVQVDANNAAAREDLVFWQTGATAALGARRSEAAIRPLLKILLTPNRAALTSPVYTALARIGPTSLDRAGAVLSGKDTELVEYGAAELKKRIPRPSDEAAKDGAQIAAVNVFSAIGTKKALDGLLAARATASPGVSVQIAAALPTLPRSAEATLAFKEIYDKTPADLLVQDTIAKPRLATAAAGFYDATLVSWLVKSGLDLGDDGARPHFIRVALLTTALKLMKKDQIGEVKKLFDAGGKEGQVGKSLEDELQLATEVLEACDADVRCYTTKLTDPTLATPEKEFAAVKAAYMIGALGDEAARDALVAILPKIESAAARLAALGAIVTLSPSGSVDVATKLEKMLTDADASGDEKAAAAARPYATIAAKLRARVE